MEGRPHRVANHSLASFIRGPATKEIEAAALSGAALGRTNDVAAAWSATRRFAGQSRDSPRGYRAKAFRATPTTIRTMPIH